MYPFPAVELTALFALYSATNGTHWRWAPNGGIPWNFTQADANPCRDRWQGIQCSSNCLSSPCYTISLDLSSKMLAGELPPDIGDFQQLTVLDLYDNHLFGTVPKEIAQLKNVTTLLLKDNQFTGTIPAEIGSMKSLDALYLSFTYLQGNLPVELAQLSNLRQLELSNTLLSGTLLPELGQLIKLADVSISNTLMHGSIPSTFGNLQNLLYLDLSSSHFSGTMPGGFGKMKKLLNLYLPDNLFTGSLSAELFSEGMQLQSFSINGNRLNGTIPHTISTLRSLSTIVLDSNEFSGSIPEQICDLPALSTFSVRDNKLEGSIPNCIGNLSSMFIFSIDTNLLTGSLPQSMENFNSIFYMNIYDNLLSGSLPAFFGAFDMLETLYAHNNRFTGTIPRELGLASNLGTVYLQHNLFSGSLPLQAETGSEFGGLTICDLSDNMLSGTISKSISGLKSLFYLSLYHNRLSGEIPSTFGDIYNLQTVLVDSNHLQGTFPDGFIALQRLQYLNMSHNDFSGSLPDSISSLTHLGYIDLSKNRFSGSISSSTFSYATGLNTLRLSDNRFTGTLNGLINPAVHLSLIQIDVGANRFSGSLPTEFFLLPDLVSLVASVNHFSGTLSSEICDYRLFNLTTLILDGMHAVDRIDLPWSFASDDDSGISRNTYLAEGAQGTLPTCLLTGETFPSLQSLQLSGTNIHDKLPSDIVLSKALNDLALAHNIMYGTIPDIFQSHPWSSLDLSFNRFSGTLSEENMSNMYEKNESTLALQNNRLSGRIPSTLIMAKNIKMLTGNLFSCIDDSSRGKRADKSSRLPLHDPAYASYECGSDYTDYALIIWTAIVLSSLSAAICVLGFGASCSGWLKCGKSGMTASEQEKTESAIRTPPHLALTSDAPIQQLRRWWSVYLQETVAGVSIKNLVSLSWLLTTMLWQIIGLVFVLLVLFMPVYAALTNYHGTYTHQYIWSVSISFLQGVTPAVVLLMLLTGLVYGIMSVLQIKASTLCVGPKSAKTEEGAKVDCSVDELDRGSSITSYRLSVFRRTDDSTGETNVTQPQDKEAKLVEPVRVISSTVSMISRSCGGDWWPFLIVVGIVLCNCVVVLVVNGLFVFATQQDYSVRILAVISFLISIFKLVWGNVVVIGGVGHYLAASLMVSSSRTSRSGSISSVQSKPNISETGQLLLLILLSLFNNIVAPYLAEAFVSSNCFKYVITVSPLVESPFRAIDCSVSAYNATKTILECSSDAPAGNDVASSIFIAGDALTNGQGVNTVRFRPPFIYNFTCSSSLLTAFAYVFVYRYLLSGLVQPVMCWAVKHLQQRALLRLLWLRLECEFGSRSSDGGDPSVGNPEHLKQQRQEVVWWQGLFQMWTDMLPLLWRPITPELQVVMESQKILSKEQSLQLMNDILVCNLAISEGSYNCIDFTQQQLGSWLDDDDSERSSLSFRQSNFRPSALRDSNFSASFAGYKRDRRQRKHAEKLVLLKKAFVVRMLCDFAVLLSFAVLFPPLSVVILTSMVSEGAQLLLSLGRFVCIVEAATTPAAIAAGSMSSLQMLLHTINADFRGLVVTDDASSQSNISPWSDFLFQTLRNCFGVTSLWASNQRRAQRLAPRLQRLVFIALCFAALFWSFSLFDTLGDDVGVESALWIIVVMAFAPIWLPLMCDLLGFLWRSTVLCRTHRKGEEYTPLQSPLLDSEESDDVDKSDNVQAGAESISSRDRSSLQVDRIGDTL